MSREISGQDCFFFNLSGMFLSIRPKEMRRAFLLGEGTLDRKGWEESLLATCASIDLNPVAAGIAEFPEASKHTSIKQRGEHVKEQGQANDLNAARARSVSGSRAVADQEGGRGAFTGPRHWLAMSGFADSRDARKTRAI